MWPYEPIGEPGAGFGHTRKTGGCGQNGTEMNGKGREPALVRRIGRKRQSASVAQVGGDDFGVSFRNEKPGAIEQFHQRTGAGKSALRE